MFGKKKKAKSNYYYDSFPALCHFSLDCAKYILDFMNSFDHEKLFDLKTNVHEIEHKADDKKHEVTARLLTEFMTPIDREDILELLRLIDDITDAVEEISLKLYLYDYQELPPDSVPFMKLIYDCVEKTEECLRHFPDFMDMKKLWPYIEEVISLEEDSDTEYIDDTHKLYLEEKNGFKRHRAEAMYTMLEETADRCREVCRFVQTIAYKNV
ncbi:MAG: DUF47 family protein [Bacilli bacterium]|jgi:predicted phosphate transport protein (TIGR00153 family)|nr:DUF47 family protein [Bacilli bacterium]